MDLEAALALAVDESVAARGVSTPNPPVGAVILDRDGAVVGRGRTAPAGGPHAEVVALADAGEAARGGTAVVTLEPCDHTGRTGPCTQALIAAGIGRVAYAAADPNPLAAGGAHTLRAAGIEVIHLATEPWPLTEWLFRQRHGRPVVTVKLAATVDGRIAAPDGTSRWITGPQARGAGARRKRAQLDAIIVGTGTVVADDPAPHRPASPTGRCTAPPGSSSGERRNTARRGCERARSGDPRPRSRPARPALEAVGDTVNVQVEGRFDGDRRSSWRPVSSTASRPTSRRSC